MATVVFLAIIILIGAVTADSHRDRRILLHSDIDVAQAIQSLKADVVQMHSKILHFETQNSNFQIQNAQLRGNVSQLQTTVTNLQSANRGTGSTYVRWGRTVCPANGTTIAYSGYMGGGQNTDTGAAVNHLCLTADPTWDHYDVNIESNGKVHGVEYEFWEHRADGAAKFFGTNLYNHDAPCAVCHSPRSAAMMIPGRNQCYPGWTHEYSGYLVSGAHAHTAATEYVCLDRRPETVTGGGTDDNENELFFVEGVCGKSLECPPYIPGRELTCVVCTK